MDFGVLGPLSVRCAGAPLELGTPKARVLLAVLLGRPGRPVASDTLAEALWGETPPKSAAKNVQTYVSRLRRCLGEPERITRQGSGYLLRTGRDELDAARFEDLVGAARAAAAGDPDRAHQLFDEALGLWRGPAFAGFADVLGLAPEAARLDELRLGVLEERIDVGIRLGRHRELLGELTALTMRHPLRERLWGQLMLALYRCGRRADALETYLQVRSVLSEEAGLEPGRSLQDLHRTILGNEQMPTSESGPAPVSPEAQLLAAVRERRTTDSARMLPPALADFSGQHAELEQIERVLRNDRTAQAPAAVVAVSGPGGIGKTALAVQAAHRLRSAYPDGQLFAVLDGVRSQPADPAAILGRFLRALGVPATAVPDDADERTSLYRGILAERRVLVVVDDALDEAQLAPLMPAGGTCGVIVTGRVRLGGLGGAHRIELRVMSEGDSLAMLRAGTADRLDSASREELSDLVRLCARLPLALRIVGALLLSRPHWGPADLVSRLADAQRRLDMLRYRDLEVRTSFGLSYEGLRPEARRLFRLLGLLEAPDFPLWAAAAAVDGELLPTQDLLDELIDVHLLEVTGTPNGQARYGFHDLIRVYARECAEAEEEATARDESVVRVLGALLAFTDFTDREHMGQNMFRREAPRWRPERVEAALPRAVVPMRLLDLERVSLVTGVRQAAALGRDELCWELAVGGHALFEVERYFDEWQECYDTAMRQAGIAGNVRGRARLLVSMAGLLYTRRWYGPAERSNSEAMILFEQIGDHQGYLEALSNAPFFLVPNGRLAEAIATGREAYERLTAGGQAAAALHAYSQVGLAHLQAGRPQAAAEVLGEIIDEARKHRILTLVARDTYWLCQAQLALGRLAEAAAAVSELSGHMRDFGASGPFYLAHARGCVQLACGEYADARRHLTEAVEVARALDDPMFETRSLIDLLDPRLYDGHEARAAIGQGEHAVEVARRIDYPYLLAGALEQLAGLHALAGDGTGAANLATEAATVRADIR
ncbi:BTAD domain-containing putative transcriptional regulator [Streptomyces sp. NPDC102381]|uniref:AfsR/SARP family transcriptional regulator n=1 Tax=Streptomyces sp. NPDC102381 TaxID=3366164 RepID=UPI00381717D9